MYLSNFIQPNYLFKALIHSFYIAQAQKLRYPARAQVRSTSIRDSWQKIIQRRKNYAAAE